MLQRLIASRLITPPAIWGKLCGHADFVRSGMRHGESEGWQPWLARHAGMADVDVTIALPAAFVLPPNTLAFAPRHFVLGAIRPSVDRAGRRHALIVYQRAHPRWVRRHFATQVQRPCDWLFWLARAVARHTGMRGGGELQALDRSVQALWQLHAPDWRELGWRRPARELDGDRCTQALLDRWAGPACGNDPARDLSGVRYLPWADWPARLHHPGAEGAFWQQDASGGFVNATHRLADLWSTKS